jgi:hypothetical protein
MGVDFIGWTPDGVDTATISLPARDAGREVFVSIGQPAIMLFLR